MENVFILSSVVIKFDVIKYHLSRNKFLLTLLAKHIKLTLRHHSTKNILSKVLNKLDN